MSRKNSKQKHKPYIKFPPLLFNEILKREFYLVDLKILLLFIRFIEGCHGNDEKKTPSGAKTIYRRGCIMLQKKDFELLGISEQRANVRIKSLVKSNVILENKIELTIHKKLQSVYCYSINPDYSLWDIPYTMYSEKLNKELHVNLSLEQKQVAKINNTVRCKRVLMKLKNKSPLEYIFEARSSIGHDENLLKMKDFFVFPALGKDISILIGTKNIITDQTNNMLLDIYNEKRCTIATFVLDLQLLLRIRVIENHEVEVAILEIVNNPIPALTELGNHWAENIAKSGHKQNYYDNFSTNLNQLLSLCNESYQEESASEVNYNQNFGQEDYGNDPD